MKILILFFLSTLFNANYYGVEHKVKFGGHRLTLQEAERILGESCRLEETSDSSKNDGHEHKSTFLANSSDMKSDKKVALYFLFESYKNATNAKNIFETFKIGNQTHDGFELINNLGSEAFFHTDKKNFCLIIARKDNELIRIKVNKITSKTSFEELKKVANDLIMRI